MKIFIASIFILGALGCVPRYPTVRSAPLPDPAVMAQLEQQQTRVVSVPMSSAVPDVVQALLDRGYLVRSVNENMGIINFYQQWRDKDQHNADIMIEGTVFMKSMAPRVTRLRVVLTGGSQTFRKGSAGGRGMDSGAMVSAVQQQVAAEEYDQLLNYLEGRLPGRAD